MFTNSIPPSARNLISAFPSPVLDHIVWTYVKLRTITGTNQYTYSVANKRITFTYTNVSQFELFFDLFDGETITTEGFDVDLFRLPERDAFVDIGAYHGLYSAIVGKLNPDIEIHSCEPNEDNQAKLKDTLKTNGITATVHSEVVTDHTGTVTFYTRAGTNSEGHSTNPHDGATPVEKESVSIAELLRAENITDPFIKIDAEGEEIKIVPDLVQSTATNTIEGIVEMHPDKMDSSVEKVLSHFDDCGYAYSHIGNTVSPETTPRPGYYFRSELPSD
jgi:FkbM family methyltransferase